MKGGQNAAGATSVASIKPYEQFAPLAPLSTSRNSPFQSANSSTPASAMAGPGFLPATQSLRPSQSSFLAPVGLGDRDATKPIGTPFSTTPPALSTALLRRLPTNTSEETVRLMMVFSKDLHSVEVLPIEQSEDNGFRAALLKFKTPSGALEAKQMLDGKSNISNDADMIVEILDASPTTGRLHPHDANGTANNNSAAASSSASSAASSRQPSRFNGAFSSLNENVSVSMGAMFSPTDMSSSDSSVHYQSIFSPQSPIGNHLTDRNRISGKTLINNDSADDDETGELLMDPLAYAENGSLCINQRRSTMPTIPVSRLASLSLNTTAPASAVSVPSYGQHSMASLNANTLSPGVMGPNSIAQMGFNQHYRTHHYPPANPADQNPPCNTLYVGNLPIDTSEEELKAMFSKCRGYKRLCFRTKQNGPMCFVEFEDVSAATKALHELYGHPLHNSVKGGIRLSFSKNPLGVRSNQNPNALAVAASMGMNGAVTPINPFTSVNGPPPGLAAPPGLGLGRLGYAAPSGLSTGAGNHYGMSGYGTASSNMWGPTYPAMAAGIPMMTGASGFPPHMMGR